MFFKLILKDFRGIISYRIEFGIPLPELLVHFLENDES